MIFNPTIIKKGGGYGAYNVNSVLLEDGTQELQITTATEKPVSKLAQVVDRTVTEITAEDLEGATSIGDYTFYKCETLQSMELPNTILSIGRYSIYNCTNLNKLVLPYNLISIQTYGISFTNLTELVIPNSVTTLYNSALEGNKQLVTITLSNSLQELSGYLFSGCNKLANVLIPEGVKIIEGYCFSHCSSLVEIVFPSSVTEMGSTIFNFCTNLTTVTIKATVPPTIQSTTFDDTVQTFYVPAESVEAYKTATNWANYADKIFAIE